MVTKRTGRDDKSKGAIERPAPPMPWARSNGHYIDGQAIIDGVDLVARDVEARYGVDRVRLLIPDDMRARFDRQRAKFISSIWDGDLSELQAQARRMIAAWRSVDAEAAKHPDAKLPPPVLFEAVTAKGTVLQFVRRDSDLLLCGKMSDGNQIPSQNGTYGNRIPGQTSPNGQNEVDLGAASPTDPRKREIWSLEELARLIEAEAFVSAIKLQFEGAKVMGVRQTIGDPLQAIESGQGLDDEIPF